MTHDTGTIHDVLADINELSRNLTDRYKLRDGFPIFKELVQNADDANAELLRISWHQGFPQSSHRLLAGPGMLVLNDGATCHQDIFNIRRLGMNYKAGERGAIGKFGLGLKSIFHLCEAFFYLAYDPNSDDPEVAQEPKVFIYNPWNGGSDENRFHSEWDLIHPEHVASLGQAVAPLRPKGRFFALWVPLRQHCHASDPIIRQFFGEKNNARAGYLPNHLIDRIARVLPMLSSLKRVEVWNSAGNRSEAFAEIEAESERRHRDIDSVNEKPHHFRGKIRVVSLIPVRESNVSYFGVELKLPPSSVATIANSDFWPRTRSRTLTGESRTAKAPADAHAAAVLVATNEAPSRLVIRHACYLPLASSDESDAARLSSHELFLHGRFFIDAGRQAIPGLDSDQLTSEPSNDEQVREAWNRRLFEHGSLPLLLKAIAKWSQSLSNGDTHHIEQITRQIEDYDPLHLWSGAICRDEQWLYLLKPPTEPDRALGSWTLKAAKAVVHEIPRPPTSIALYDLLPGIAAVSSDRALTFADCPRISANGTAPWPPKTLANVLESLVPGSLFASSEHLKYLADFLNHCAVSEGQQLAVGAALWPLLKKAFQDDSFTLQQIEELGDSLCRVLEFVPEEHRLVLSWASSERRGAETVFRMFAADPCGLLPIPQHARPPGRDCGKAIENHAVIRILKGINALSLDREMIADVIEDLLDRADPKRQDLKLFLGDLTLVWVSDCRIGREKRITWNEFDQQRRRRLVFHDGWTQLLQDALGSSGTVWRVNTQFAEKVFGRDHEVPRCDAEGCAAVLAPSSDGKLTHLSGATLGEWGARKKLVTQLIDALERGSPQSKENVKTACRLLFHGRLQDAGFNRTLFLSIDQQVDQLAERLVQHVLAKRHEEWRILTGEPAAWAVDVEEGLKPSKQKCLDVYPLTLAVALDFLKEKAHGDQLELNLGEDYAKLLMVTDASQNDVLKELPIHPTINDKRPVAIRPTSSQRFLWNDDYPLDGIPLEGVTLLKLHHKSEVKRRQKDIHSDVLGPAEAIDLAIGSSEPEKHWETILKAIEKLLDRPTDEILAKLRDKSWLPSRFGASNCKDLICISHLVTNATANLSDDFRQRVTRLAEDWLGAVPDWMLDEAIFKQLTESRKSANGRLHEWNVFPDKNQSLQRLSKLLAKDSRNHIGEVPLDQFNDWLAIDWDASVMPAHQVLKAVADLDLVGPDICFEHASADVRRPIEDHDRLVAILNWLAQCHEQRLPNQDLVLRVFGNYFGILTSSNDGHIPKGLEKLLAQSGKWQRPKDLCLPTKGIADHCQLHRDLAKFLSKSPSDQVSDDFEDQPYEPGINENPTLTDDVDHSAPTVRDYFCPWEIRVQLPVIGGFLAVLGADAHLGEYAERVLGKFRLEDIRKELVRQVDGAFTNRVMTPRPAFGSSTTIGQADGQTVGPLTDRVASFNRTYFSIRVVSAKTEKMRNIIGGDLDAELNTEGDDLLLGFGDGSLVQIERDGTRRVCSIRLRRIMIESKSQDDLNRILCAATQSILVEAFRVPIELAKSQSKKIFDDLAHSDQLEISVTQRMILSGAFATWEQLGLSSDPAFGPKLAELQRCVGSPPQNRTSPKRGNDSNRGLEDAYRALQDLIETDIGAQERCLAAVRHQVGDNNQYNHESVLFELAQNADDALLETNKGEPIRLFLHPDRIAIRHFGRKINQVPPESTSKDDRRADDLWKMLTLWLTNKNKHDADLSQIKLTGKFGLGFKSVFLVSNQPRLLSGQLSCEIVGGVFPRYLNTANRECFDRYLTDLTTPEQKLAVTVIELPLNPRGVDHGTGAHSDEVASKPSHIDSASICGRFRELAHLLVVFSQRIRRIEIVDEATRKTHRTEWQDQPVLGVTGCFKGTLQPLPDFLVDPTSVKPRSNNDVLARRVLVLRTSQHGGALLLVHDGLQFQKLPKEVPTLWVTAPTLETLDVGFALNARFSLDPGRAQLGRESPKNNEIAAELGRELGQRLVALFEHSRKVGWPQFCQDIGLDSDANEYKFWDSLWELLGPGLSSLSEKSNAAKLLLQVFWQADWSAARYFYSSSRALPNGLDAEFACLTAVRDVRYELRGLVAELRVLERVATWTAWEQKKMAPASCLGRERVVIPLEKLGRLLGHSAEVAKLETEVVKLEDMLKCEIAAVSPMSSETATRLSEVLFSEPCVSKEFEEAGEWKQIIPILKAVALPDRTGNSQPAKQLLFGTLPENMNDAFLADEVKLAAFAFSDRVLCRQFLIGKSVRSVVRLIRKCRGDQELKAQDIGGWALNASLAEAKKAVEHYLAQGRRRDEVIEALRSRDAELRCSWLAGLVGTNVLQTAGEREQGIVDCIVHYETRRARLAQSDDILRKVLDWWRSPERPFLDPRRYRLFDPTQHGPLRMDYDRDDIAQRKAWMRLFLLGISHTMGRTSASQDAGFICDFCEERGWLDVFVELDGDPDRWIRLLRDYLEAQIDTSQYLHWMRQFVAIFAMAERLDDYVASFLSIERKSSRFGLTAITCPGTSNEAPVDAPPIARILGMGACFIVRELLRLKVLTNHLAWEHAFVPKGEVRQLLEILGCTFESKSDGPWMWSREIWSFLKEKFSSDNNAIFELGFDLPFQMLAHKDNSAKRLELLSVDWQYNEADDQQD